MNDQKQKDGKDMETKLSGHDRVKKELRPPFSKLGFSNSSWIDARLPEMLWAVLVVSSLEREKALDLFRHIAKFVQDNPTLYDITHTGISEYPLVKQKEFVRHLMAYSDQVKNILSPMMLLEKLPVRDIWSEVLGEPDAKKDWTSLEKAVSETLWHQTQAATDCRWIKIHCFLLGGKLHFAPHMADKRREILEYPNYGDQSYVRASIRSLEVMPKEGELEREWPVLFWQESYEKTQCIPEEALSKKIHNRQKQLQEEAELVRKSYFDQTVAVRHALIDHFFGTAKGTSIDARHEAVFGFALYGFTLFTEMILFRSSLSVTGRLGLRALVESYITLAYCLKKEKAEPEIWAGYRSFGVGQAKLTYLKLKEIGDIPSSVALDYIRQIVNEDQWMEFSTINLGHWNEEDLRKMSESVGLKKEYDRYYSYTSGFMHASWGAVRESMYQLCINSLHRLHRVPSYDLPLMPSVIEDAQKLINGILGLVSNAYPSFDLRFETPEGELLQQQGEVAESEAASVGKAADEK